MVWWINKHKHSISIVHIFCVILFKAFCKFLRLRNSHGIFGGLIFGQGFFGGLLLEAPGISLGIDFCPHSIIPITWNPEYLQPWGRDSLFTRGTCLILHIYMYGLWGGHLFGGGRLLEREFILGNTMPKVLYMIQVWNYKPSQNWSNSKKVLQIQIWNPRVTFAMPTSQMPCYSTWISWLSVGEGGGLLTGEWQYHQPGTAAALVL